MYACIYDGDFWWHSRSRSRTSVFWEFLRFWFSSQVAFLDPRILTDAPVWGATTRDINGDLSTTIFFWSYHQIGDGDWSLLIKQRRLRMTRRKILDKLKLFWAPAVANARFLQTKEGGNLYLFSECEDMQTLLYHILNWISIDFQIYENQLDPSLDIEEGDQILKGNCCHLLIWVTWVWRLGVGISGPRHPLSIFIQFHTI